MTTGSVTDGSSRPYKVRNPEVEHAVQEIFTSSLHKSIRQEARESGLSFLCVRNVLKMSLNGVLESHTTAKHSLSSTATFVRNL